MILLIDNYDSFTYNLYQQLLSLGESVRTVRNDAITLSDIERMRPDAIIISPGPGRPEDAGISESVIREFSSVYPILGICLGHQAIADVFSVPVIHAPMIVHGKSSRVFHTSDPVFSSVGQGFQAARYHSLVADRERLNDDTELIAWTEDDIVMAIKIKGACTYGFQFHPESILTPDGSRLMMNFLKEARRA